MRRRFAGAFIALAIATAAAPAQPIKIVAAENFYGDIARQIGGGNVAVTSILTNPDQDPHEFEASPSTARALADADVVVYNGADYDPWAQKLLAASPSSVAPDHRRRRARAQKTGRQSACLVRPAHGVGTGSHCSPTRSPGSTPCTEADYREPPCDIRKIDERRSTAQIAELRQKYAGTPVTATEPVFGYMADALGLDMRNSALSSWRS